MKIQLVNPCMNEGYEVNSRNGVMHPLGLLSIATYAQRSLHNIDIEILDGSIESRAAINAVIGADIVGCTTGILSYEHAIEIGHIAKNKGATVVFGGPLASTLPHQVLQNRLDVDCVVVGDGEEAFCQLVAGVPPDRISNLAYRSAGSVVLNPIHSMQLDSLPYCDRTFLDVRRYFENYQLINAAKAFSRPITYYSGKGCSYATHHQRCVFCARMDKGYRIRHPIKVWEELQTLSSRYGADAFWDVADSVLSDRKWLREFEETRPAGFSPRFVIYGRAEDVTPDACARLKRLNCHQVFVGFESGNDDILRGVGLGKTLDIATNAARLLAEHGITIMASLILGLPGETEETVKDTIEFAHWLDRLGNLETISASVLMPLPGSRVFSQLRADMPEKYETADYFNLEDARNDWLELHTHVSADYLFSCLPELLSVGRVSSTLGTPTRELHVNNLGMDSRGALGGHHT